MCKILLVLNLLLLVSCVEPPTESSPVVPSESPTLIKNTVENITIDSSIHHIYPWLETYDYQSNIVNQIPVPDGFTRTKLAQNSFADWLRHLPLKNKNAKVLLHNGQEKFNQNVHERVIDIDTGKRDLQQCADATMRLKASYHYSKKEYANIHFNFTSGHRVAFEDWAKQKKPIIRGNKVTFSAPTNKTDYSYQNFKKYLQQIFMYAGTASLSKELVAVPVENMKIGDVFIQGGFPGHAVIVLDMAVNEEGQSVFLLAQSYMPAQDIHILKNNQAPKNSPWYSTDFGDDLETPEWRFSRNDLKRWK